MVSWGQKILLRQNVVKMLPMMLEYDLEQNFSFEKNLSKSRKNLESEIFASDVG